LTMAVADLWEPQIPRGTPATRLHVWDRQQYVPVTQDEWRANGQRAASALRRLGVRPGDRVGCVLTNTLATCSGVLGIWFAGATVVSLPTLARGLSTATYVAQLERLCRHSEAALLLVEDRYAAILEELLDPASDLRIRRFESLDGGPVVYEPPGGADDAVFVQYSSGSTTEPKGCLLSAGAIAAQMERLAEALDLDPRVDRGVSWLPLSHDMGLFGCVLLSWTHGMPLALGAPERFLASPASWVADLSDFGSTITAGPNFALERLARSARAARARDPFPMRKWVVGAERVEWWALETVASLLAPLGMRLDAFCPAYGLAEATLAVTMVRPSERPAAISVDAEALAGGRVEEVQPGGRGTTLTALGRPLRDVRVEAGSGATREIVVASPSLAAGYVGAPEATAERFVGGTVRTGDIGFLGPDGALYMAGRADDMISVAGRKIHARDLERALDSSAGVRPGACVLVDGERDGRRHLILLAEPAKDVTDAAPVARALTETARSVLGIRVDDCWIVPAGTIPKTPSGKIQRYRCRELVERREVDVLGRAWR
jgi:fatty-acyl-CoA synthase